MATNYEKTSVYARGASGSHYLALLLITYKCNASSGHTLSSNPWKRMIGHENFSTKLMGDLSKYAVSLPAIENK